MHDSLTTHTCLKRWQTTTHPWLTSLPTKTLALLKNNYIFQAKYGKSLSLNHAHKVSSLHPCHTHIFFKSLDTIHISIHYCTCIPPALTHFSSKHTRMQCSKLSSSDMDTRLPGFSCINRPQVAIFSFSLCSSMASRLSSYPSLFLCPSVTLPQLFQ